MIQITNTEKTICYHCGDDCPRVTYTVDDKSFCCQGCKSVYQVLTAGKLSNYYSYNNHPGTSRKQTDKRFDYLGNPEIMAKLVDYADERIAIVTLYVPQIHCSSCLWLLEQLHNLNPAIYHSRVDFLKKTLNLKFNVEKFSLQKVVEMLFDIGYEPVISLQDVIKEQNKAGRDNLVKKIAVAGFCFGNVMLLSFPEYFGITVSEASFKNFFGLINLVFTLPVVFYSGREYFVSAYHNLRNRILNIDFPLALGIAVLFIRTAFEIFSHTGAGFADTLCGLVFFLLIGKFVQRKTYHHISFERDYRSFFPVAVQILEDDKEKPVPLANLKAGQRMVIRHNEIIPADAILLKGEALVDFSFVTGESALVNKTLGEIIYAGGRQAGSTIELEVVKSVSQSYLTQLWNNEAFSRKQGNRMKTFSEKVSKYFSVALLAIAVTSLVFWLTFDYRRGLAAFTAVLIVACPCALALSTPFTMSAALSIFDKNLFYLKNTRVVEQMAAINTIVMDKTGTITISDESNVKVKADLNEYEKQLVYAACSNSIHPLSRMICRHLGSPQRLPVTSYLEIPGKGIYATIDGHDLEIGNGALLFGDETKDPGISHVHVAIDKKQLGYFSFYHRYREGIEDVAALTSGYGLYLLSGDQDHEKKELLKFFAAPGHMRFNQSPQNKLDFISSLQQKGQKVMMIGDGLNDSGALKQSDLGVAVTDNVNNFSPGCDAILDGRSFNKIPAFLRFSKQTVKVIHGSFLISLTYNIVGLSYAVTGRLSPLIAAVLMPLSTVTIISFTTIATHFAAKKCKLL